MMKSKKYFSFPFFKDIISRIYLPVLIALIATVASSCINTLPYLFILIDGSYLLSGSVTSLSFETVNGFGDILVTIFVPIVTVYAYAFLMKRCDSDFYSALPITRTAMLTSGTLAVFSVSFTVLLVSTALPLLLLIPCYGKVVTLSFGKFALAFLARVLAMLLAIAAATVAVSVCGKATEAGAVAYLILCAPRLMMWLINSILSLLNPALVSGHIIPFFDNHYNIFTSIMVNSDIAPIAYLYTLLLTACYSALAWWLFNRRRSERATHKYENTIVAQTVKVTVTTLFILASVALLCIDIYMMCFVVFIVIAAAAYYLGSSISSARKEKDGKASLISLLVLFGLNALIIAFIFIANAIMLSFSPDKDEISSVSVVASENSSYLDFAEYVDLRSENIEIKDDTVKVIIANALDRGMEPEGASQYVLLPVKIKTGIVSSYRYVLVTETEYENINIARSANEEFESLWLDVSAGAENPSVYHYGFSVTGAAAKRILSTMKSEIESVGFTAWYSYYMYDTSTFSISYYAYCDGTEYTVSLSIPSALTETVRVCEEELTKVRKDAYDDLKEQLYDAVDNDDALVLSVDFNTMESYYYIEEKIFEDNAYSQGIIDGIFELISYDIPSYDDNVISIYCYSGDFDDSVYYSFKLSDGVTEDDVKNYFKLYGEAVE